MMEDFNEIMSNTEKQGGTLKEERPMRAFCNVLEECGLADMDFQGRWYMLTR